MLQYTSRQKLLFMAFYFEKKKKKIISIVAWLPKGHCFSCNDSGSYFPARMSANLSLVIFSDHAASLEFLWWGKPWRSWSWLRWGNGSCLDFGLCKLSRRWSGILSPQTWLEIVPRFPRRYPVAWRLQMLKQCGALSKETWSLSSRTNVEIQVETAVTGLAALSPVTATPPARPAPNVEVRS